MRKILVGLCVFFLVFQIAVAQEVRPPVPGEQVERKQIPPDPSTGRSIYVTGHRPFLWEHPGTDPYVEGGVKTREELAEMAKKESFITDLKNHNGVFTSEQAEFIRDTLLAAASPDSKVSEVNLVDGTAMEIMRYGKGVVPMVILKAELPTYGGMGNTWQFVLPERLGSRVIWIPKICGNICLSPFPAAVQETTIRTETQIVEVPKIVDRPVMVDRPVVVEKQVPVFVEKPIFVDRPVPQPATIKKSSKWPWIAAGIAGAAVAGILLPRMGERGIVLKKTYPTGGVISPP